MDVWLEINRTNGFERRQVRSEHGSVVGTVDGACPGCERTPFLVKGHGAQRHGERTLRAGVRCVDCGDPVGYVYARIGTIFGLEEDERVLNGRARVYG